MAAVGEPTDPLLSRTMATDDSANHPALIAKYLLKGYCLLNEYCPNGKNVPLVKSRDGMRICCCGDPTCQYNEQAQLGGAAQPSAASAATARTPVPVAAAAPAPEAWNSPSPVAMNSAVPVAADLSAERMLQDSGASMVEVGVQGPELHFGCTRLVVAEDYRPKLLGRSFSAKVKVSLPFSDQTNAFKGAALNDLKAAVALECGKLEELVFVPQQNTKLAFRAAEGQVIVTASDGMSCRFEFPQHQCLQLPCVNVEPFDIAAALWQRVNASAAAAALKSSGAQWMEVCVIESSVDESSFRRKL